MFPYLFILILWPFTLVNCFSIVPRQNNNPCELSGNSWIPYTGYRIQREVTLVPTQGRSLLVSLMQLFFQNNKGHKQFDTVDHVLVTRCDRGHVMYEAAARISDSDTDNGENNLSRNIWNTTVCTTDNTEISQVEEDDWNGPGRTGGYELSNPLPKLEHNCFRLARRIKYLENNSHELRSLIPGSIVGALFDCVQNINAESNTCTAQNTFPVLPLVADKPYHVWTRLVGTPTTGGGFSIRIPLFYTPDVMDKQYPRINTRWAKHPGTRSFHMPHYIKEHQVDRNWARSIDPFEQYVHKGVTS